MEAIERQTRRERYLDVMYARMGPAADVVADLYPDGLPSSSTGYVLNRIRDTTGQLAEATLAGKKDDARRLSGTLVFWATQLLETIA